MKIIDGKKYFKFKLSKSDYIAYAGGRMDDFIQDIKRNIPSSHRMYIAGKQTWIINNEYRRQFDAALARHLSDQKEIF